MATPTDKEFEALGPGEVAARIATKVYLGGDRAMAEAWLARNNAASSAEQLSLARRASDDARDANRIASTALRIAKISVAATIIATAVAIASVVISLIAIFR